MTGDEESRRIRAFDFERVAVVYPMYFLKALLMVMIWANGWFD